MRLVAVVASLLFTSCMLNPLSGTPVDSSSTEVSFGGLAIYQPGLRIRIQMQEPGGVRFTQLGLADVPTNGLWTATVSVPERAWWSGPCSSARFRFVATNRTSVQGLDAACLRAAGPSPELPQTIACLVPIVELFRGQTHAGDLSVSGQVEADAQACVTVVDGDLTVDAGGVAIAPGVFRSGVGFVMPNLEAVTGSLTVDSSRAESVAFPRLGAVGGDLALTSRQFGAFSVPEVGDPVPAFAVSAYALPAVTSVGGAVSLTVVQEASAGGGGSVVHEFGLDALASVGTDVSIDNGGFPTAVQGLRGLTSIPRDLLLDWGPTDLDSTELLSALAAVGRDAAFVLPPNARHGLASLASVGRHLSFSAASTEARIGDGFLPILASVAGDATIEDGASQEVCGASPLGALTVVGGILRFVGGRPDVAFGASGAEHLALGGLEVSGSTTPWVPLHGDVTVAPQGPLSFSENPELCECQIASFAAGLADRGWAGALVTLGNGAAAACARCPAATCP